MEITSIQVSPAKKCPRYCNCPPGFTGDLCERPVCATNPCNSGGTCLSSKTGPGFLCLCALGYKE